MHKYQFDAIEIDFLGRTISPAGVKPPNKELLTSWKLEKKTKFPKSKKALRCHLGFLSYYRNYIPRLSKNWYHSSNSLKGREVLCVHGAGTTIQRNQPGP